MLLTPPNSISPTLPAHKHRPGLPVSLTPHPPSDSDMDLQEAVEHAAVHGQRTSALSREALAGLEAEGAITAEMLAKQYLPEIFKGQDTMPIKDIMSHLAQNVPGYARIPQAKARRLCVAALEYREGGGMNGEFVFEKVGWGRWSSHPKGHAPQGRGVPISGATRPGLTPPASVDSAVGLQIPKNMRGRVDYTGSWAAGSMMSSRDEEMADRMSLDGSETSESASEMDLEHDLDDDDTDVEDWAAIGPQALREAARGHRTVYRDYNYLSRMSGARNRSTSAQSVSLSRAGRVTTPALNSSYSASRDNAADNTTTTTTINTASGSGVLGNRGQNTQEREAIAALLAMGSM
ncbi:hypothetical protein EJ04DRAFT_428436 [Polyplosphaeria fusca]|uniref:Sin3 binding protein-domain-containing protein n=1 Tax=Polyplosphaeria fusca TaxID=682080 RepID=A0A9P4R839_9PLEO|nr:hypothetical protein EJ04DRAFT_428436 [Polyplosphaeria fusca]